jgi:outer membrane protein OmpA-like peptidoglycan-associated protein
MLLVYSKLACLWLALFAATTFAHASDDAERLGLQLRLKVQTGGESPALILNPEIPIKSLIANLKPVNGGRPVRLRTGRLSKGERKILPWKQGIGTTTWIAQTTVIYANNERSVFKLTFESTVYPKVASNISKADVDLENQEITVRLNQPLARIDLIIIGDDGKEMYSGSEEFEDIDANTPTSVSWTPKAGVGVLTIDVKVWSIFGFWVSTRITPIEINIPHEDVEFESGKWAVRTSEAPKIDATLEILSEKLKRYGGLVQLQLFVVGYTDTVGSKAANRELSEKRARSIATYFRRNGVKLPIYYQGFGEDVLAVKTPDETAEARNRRAVYILAGSPPEQQTSIPQSRWKRL